MRIRPPWLALAFLTTLTGLQAREATLVSDVTLNTPQVSKFGKLEISFQLNLEVENPFDPEQIDIIAVLHTPSGKQVLAPAFYYQGFVREPAGGGNEKLYPNGKPQWKVRFAPTERGLHFFTIEVRAPGLNYVSPEYSFRCTGCEGRGFLRVANNNQTFEFDDGMPWFAVGLNTCWGNSTFDFDRWFSRLSENGGNYGRLWVGPIALFTLEEEHALGRYNQANAWRLDYVTDLAAQKNIFLMLCLESFNSLRMSPEYQRWDWNPYNAANGGPCAMPEEFFTDDAARKLFQQRLRYIVARWGYSTHVLAWEFWNEVDLAENYSSKPVRDWHVEMARFIRSIDANKHLLTTSFANSNGDPLIDALPEMDFVQTHNYGASDIAAELSQYCFAKSQHFHKPHFVGEFGLHWEGKGNERDTEGTHLVEGIWSAALSLSAGTAMTWWWDTYVDPKALWPRYAPLAKFAADVDWSRHTFHPAEVELSYATPQPPQNFDFTLQGKFSEWKDHASNGPQSVTVLRDGTVQGAENLSANLHGIGNHPTWHNPLTLDVDGASPWKFTVVVAGVSDYGGARLQVYVDDELFLDNIFFDNDPLRGGTMNSYDGDYILYIPPGRHVVQVLNSGTDWMTCRYKFSGYAQKTTPELRTYGVQDSREALIWVQNDTASFRARNDGSKSRVVSDGLLTVSGMRDDEYRVEVWNTLTGLKEEKRTRSEHGRMQIALPPIDSNIALRIRKK